MKTAILDESAGPFSAKRGSGLRWRLVSLCLSMLMPSLDTSIANAGLPTLARALAASFQDVQWIILAYLLAITTLIVSAGRLGDILGRGRLLLVGIGVFTAASLVCGLAPTLWLLIAARAVQGLGAATMMALSVALVADTVPQEKTGRAMGLLGTMSAIGTTLGPSLGGILIAGLGWRTIFLINVPLGILNFALAYRSLPARNDRTAPTRVRFDFTGTFLLALTLGAYALAMTFGRGQFSLVNAVLLIAAVLGAAAFLRVESKLASPLIRWTMFADPLLAASLASTLVVSTVLMTTLVVGPFYLTLALGLPAAFAGFALSAGPLVAALMGIPAGHIVDRYGARNMTIAGLVGIAGGALTLALLPLQCGVVGYVVPIAFLTSSYALFQAANNTALMKNVGSEQRGAVSGMLSLARNLGLITGTALMGAIFALAATTSDLAAAQPQSIAAAMRLTFAVAAVLIAAVIAAVLIARNHMKRASRPQQSLG